MTDELLIKFAQQIERLRQASSPLRSAHTKGPRKPDLASQEAKLHSEPEPTDA